MPFFLELVDSVSFVYKLTGYKSPFSSKFQAKVLHSISTTVSALLGISGAWHPSPSACMCSAQNSTGVPIHRLPRVWALCQFLETALVLCRGLLFSWMVKTCTRDSGILSSDGWPFSTRQVTGCSHCLHQIIHVLCHESRETINMIPLI